MKLRWLTVVVCIGFAAGCGEDKHYDFSANCGEPNDMQKHGIYGRSERVENSGLTCVYYNVTGPSTVHIDISEIMGACGGPYGGTVNAEGNNAFTIELESEYSGPTLWCVCHYNFSFDIADVDVNKELLFTLWVGSGCYTELTFPLATAPRGVACSYNDMSGGGTDGTPCGEDGGCGSADFTCVQEDPTYKTCRAICETDPDCAGDGIYRCEQNVCVLANPLTPCNT